MGFSAQRIVIIAGPNGAGKTTFAREFLPNEGDCLNFVNADLIAAELSPFVSRKSSAVAGKLSDGFPDEITDDDLGTDVPRLEMDW